MDDQIRVAEIRGDKVYSISVLHKGKLIGGAWVLYRLDEEGKKALYLLLDICIYNEKYRRKGYATKMLEVITEMFPKVVTASATKAGKELCRKFGFELHKSFTKSQPEMLIYEKDKGNI